jgi:NADP-dependent 3-hydroxy acid dehydrogenase YdfG
MTTKNDQNLILVTGASGNVGTELIKELSITGAIFREGVQSNKSSDKIVDCVDINFGIVLANL